MYVNVYNYGIITFLSKLLSLTGICAGWKVDSRVSQHMFQEIPGFSVCIFRVIYNLYVYVYINLGIYELYVSLQTLKSVFTFDRAALLFTGLIKQQ